MSIRRQVRPQRRPSARAVRRLECKMPVLLFAARRTRTTMQAVSSNVTRRCEVPGKSRGQPTPVCTSARRVCFCTCMSPPPRRKLFFYGTGPVLSKHKNMRAGAFAMRTQKNVRRLVNICAFFLAREEEKKSAQRWAPARQSGPAANASCPRTQLRFVDSAKRCALLLPRLRAHHGEKNRAANLVKATA